MSPLDPFGIAVFILATTACIWAFRLAAGRRYTVAVVLLILAGGLLRFELCSTPYLHDWDERYHALVAKNLIEEPFRPKLYPEVPLPYNSEDWSASYIWLHKQPVPLWSMAISMAVFGVNELALRLPSLVLSTLGIWLMFGLGKALYNARVGFLAAFLFTIHGLILELTAGMVATDHIDLFFTVFILAAVYSSLKFHQTEKWYYNLFAGVLIGLAILSKWLPALIVLPIWVLFSLEYRGVWKMKHTFQLAWCSAIACIVFLPWQIYIFQVFPKEAAWEYAQNSRHMFEVLDSRGGPFYYHFDKARAIYGELIYLPMLWVLWKAIEKWQNAKRWVVVVWIFIPFLFFSFVETKMQGYTMFTAPALFLATALLLVHLRQSYNAYRYKWLVRLVALLLLLLPVRYSLERSFPELIFKDEKPWAHSLKSMASKGEQTVLFNYNRPMEAMFYGYRLAYEGVPSEQELKTILNLGYKVQVNTKGTLPERIIQHPEVGMIKLKE